MRCAALLLGLSLALASLTVAQPSKEDFGAPAVDAPPEVKRIDFFITIADGGYSGETWEEQPLFFEVRRLQ
ncbi:MAG: hypothetical protein E2P02_18595 [Acidobacteria bacterium]|nr:MAG: hypothetical protein E2P02_18595 [Acidobacteriota bacterium]